MAELKWSATAHPAAGRMSRAERPVEVGVRTEWADADRSLDEAVAQVRAYEAAGADYVAVWFGDLDGFEERMTALAGATA